MSLAQHALTSDGEATLADADLKLTDTPSSWSNEPDDAVLCLYTFCRHHPESSGWRHGLLLPDAIMSYRKIDPQPNANQLCDWYENHNVASVAILGPVTHEVYSSKNEPKYLSLKTGEFVAPSPPPHDISPFDGLMSFSDITLLSSRNPHLLHESSDYPPLDFINSAPKLCYQNNFDMDDITYTFGGLHITSQLTLSRYDIPLETPLSKILVHLPVKLPPHISRKILSNPLLAPNINMFSYCPLRSNITHLDLLSRPNDPKGICGMISCEVSPHHVFYYGGFTILDTVEYRHDMDRFIIRRRLVMNVDGYILNTRTQRFSKVELKPHQKQGTNYGRIGAAACAKPHRQNTDPSRANLVARPQSPPIQFTYTSEETHVSPALNSHQQFVTPPLTTPRTARTIPNIPRATSLSVSPRGPSTARLESQHQIEYPIPARPAPTATIGWQTDSSTHHRTLSATASNASTVSNVSSQSLALISRHKMSNVFSKPARMFHKSHLRHFRSSETASESASSVNVTPRPRDLKLLFDDYTSKRSTLTAAESDRSVRESTSRLRLRSKKSFDRVAQMQKLEHATSNASLDRHGLEFERESISLLPKTVSTLRTPPSQGLLQSTPEYTSPRRPQKSSAIKTQELLQNSSVATTEAADGVYNGVSILIFGGFLLEEQEGNEEFKACNDMLKIDLASRDDAGTMGFYDEAIILESAKIPDQEWPSPRGYFGKAVVCAHRQPLVCTFALRGPLMTSGDDISIQSSYRPQSPQSASSTVSTFQTFTLVPPAAQSPFFLDSKELVIHGGCNEQGDVFSDLYILSLDDMLWLLKDTFLLDHHENKKMPYEDDDCTQLTQEKRVASPKLVEAELRSCHHSLIYYKTSDSDLLMFIGGFQNDYLRLFDDKQYVSDKYDVLRLGRFGITNSETNVQRVPCLDLLTLTWRYLRYYHEFSRTFGPEQRRLLRTEPWRNSRMNHHAGRVSLTGKVITVCHGLVTITPEKAQFKDAIWKDVGPDAYWGSQVSLEFPGL